MRQSKRLSRRLRSEARAASDMARQQLGWYVRNCALSPAGALLERVMLERLHRLKGNLEGDIEDLEFDDNASVDARNLSRRRQEFRCILKEYSAMPSNDDGSELNVLFARDEFGLDDIDTEILLLLLRYERNNDLEQFADEVLHRLHGPAAAVAALLGIDRREARRRIAADSLLIESGLICSSEDGCSVGLAGQSGYLQLARPVRKVMYHSYASRQEWVAALIGEPLATPLAWEDFDHLGSVRELAAKMMAGAGKNGASSINLLLHGPVGTGKTEFAKTLAAHVGMSIWSIGETDDKGGEPTRGERLAALKLAQRLLAKRASALVLLDEAEDILASEMPFFGPFASRSRDRSKVYLNRLIEQNAVPVVWTCNDVAAIDPAVLRRMTLAVEVRTPGRPARMRIWRRVLNETGLRLGDDAVERLSSRYSASAPPAVAANAARAVMLSGGGEAAVEEAMGGVLQLLGIGASIPDADASDFDPALVNCDRDLAGLTGRLVRPGASRQWSLCLSGSPDPDS
jgi:transitional endoplasmic reticulum ATPase